MSRKPWREEAIGLAGLQRGAFEERDHSSSTRVSSVVDILRDGEGEPRPVVRNARAHALPECGSTNANVALDELAAGRAQKVRGEIGRAAASAMPSCN